MNFAILTVLGIGAFLLYKKRGGNGDSAGGANGEQGASSQPAAGGGGGSAGRTTIQTPFGPIERYESTPDDSTAGLDPNAQAPRNPAPPLPPVETKTDYNYVPIQQSDLEPARDAQFYYDLIPGDLAQYLIDELKQMVDNMIKNGLHHTQIVNSLEAQINGAYARMYPGTNYKYDPSKEFTQAIALAYQPTGNAATANVYLLPGDSIPTGTKFIVLFPQGAPAQYRDLMMKTFYPDRMTQADIELLRSLGLVL